MTQGNTEIVICRTTRRNMSFGLLWPGRNEELDHGKWYFIKIFVYSLITITNLGISWTHFYVGLKNHKNSKASEDVAVMLSIIGTTYMVFIYVKNQPKVALLLRDLSNFNTFGLPPDFEQQEKLLNFLSNVSFAYAIFASLLYNLVRLYQRPECEETKMEKETCGFIVPIWLPFEINYFPLYEFGFFYMYSSTVLILKSALVIPFHAFEISQHIILRIKHLNTMILNCLDGDYEECRKNLHKCIHYHREIIEFATRLDSYFSSCMFCHLTITAAVCACIEKQFVEGDKLCAGLHVIGWFLVLFISCVAGQFLTDASASIPEAIWNSRWRQADPKLKKDVLFLLLRCQKNIYFSAGPFGILSFNLFVGVVKMSYSILCLLTS